MNLWVFETLMVEIIGASFELFELGNLHIKEKWANPIFINGFIRFPYSRSAGGEIGAVPEISAERIQISTQIRQFHPLGCKSIRNPKSTINNPGRKLREITEMLRHLPMKSMIRRPSLSLPDGLLKNTSPYGHRMGSKAAEMAPVSEFESPKLKITGKSQSGEAIAGETPTTTWKIKNADITIAGNSIFVLQLIFGGRFFKFRNPFRMCCIYTSHLLSECFTFATLSLSLYLFLHYLLRRSAAMARASVAVLREQTFLTFAYDVGGSEKFGWIRTVGYGSWSCGCDEVGESRRIFQR